MSGHWHPLSLTAEGRQMVEDRLRWAGVTCDRQIAILVEEYEEQLAAGGGVPLPAEDMTAWIQDHTMPAAPLP